MTARQLTVAMLVIVSLLYAVAAAGYWYAERHGMAVAFGGYILANLGLVLDAL